MFLEDEDELLEEEEEILDPEDEESFLEEEETLEELDVDDRGHVRPRRRQYDEDIDIDSEY